MRYYTGLRQLHYAWLREHVQTGTDAQWRLSVLLREGGSVATVRTVVGVVGDVVKAGLEELSLGLIDFISLSRRHIIGTELQVLNMGDNIQLHVRLTGAASVVLDFYKQEVTINANV
jgi:hypothetical protein